MFTLPAKTWLTTYFINLYFIWGIFLPFWGIWLTGKGVTNEQVGILFSIGLVLRFISGLSVLPHVTNASLVLRFIRVLAFLVLLIFASFFYVSGFLWLSALTLLVNFMIAPMMPLGDVVGSHLVKQIQLDYGRVRLWGSVSFIIGSTVVGWTIVEFGLQSVLIMLLLASILLWGMSLAQLRPHLVEHVEPQQSEKNSLLKLLKKRDVILFLLIVGIIQGSHGAYYAYSTIYWDSLGITGNIIAWLWGISVFAEVIILRFSRQLFAKWSIKQMLLLALIGGVIRWSVISLTADTYLLAVVQTLHALTFAVTHLAAMRYISQQKVSHLVTYQTLYSSVALGLFMALFTYIAGISFDLLQGDLFLLSAILLLPVFLLLKLWK